MSTQIEWRDCTDDEVQQLSDRADDEEGDLEQDGQWLGLYQDPAGGGVILACIDGSSPSAWTAGSTEDLAAAWHELTGRRAMTPRALAESLPCGCRVQYADGGRPMGLAAQCDEATAIFARHASQPETAEASAARTADFDEHFAAQRGQQ